MIPGVSLTTTPGNAPYERPPETQDPAEATRMHVEKLNDPETMEAVVDFLEMGASIKTIVEGITRNAVMNGIHSIDVSMLVAPVLHELIKGNADALGVKYKEGFEEDPKVKKQMSYRRDKMKAKQVLKEIMEEDDLVQEDIQMAPTEEPIEEFSPEEMEAPQGLMQRRT